MKPPQLNGSLEAELTHWQDGRTLLARDWIEELYTEVWPTAKHQGFSCFLSPVRQILAAGNQAQQWLQCHAQGDSVPAILGQTIAAIAQEELDLKDKLCRPVTV